MLEVKPCSTSYLQFHIPTLCIYTSWVVWSFSKPSFLCLLTNHLIISTLALTRYNLHHESGVLPAYPELVCTTVCWYYRRGSQKQTIFPCGFDGLAASLPVTNVSTSLQSNALCHWQLYCVVTPSCVLTFILNVLDWTYLKYNDWLSII